MNPYYHLKRTLKLARWRYRRARVSLFWGSKEIRGIPAVLGNAMPKSGSHLIIQVLQGLTRIGPFVDPGFPPVNRAEDNSLLPDPAVLANINRLQPGDIAYGYIQARQPFLSAFTSGNRAMVFMYRDPRDMVVSHVFYATEIHKGHGMHRYYTRTLHSMEERLNAAIQGVDEADARLSPVRRKYEKYMDWLEQPGVLCLRFEDLILEREAALECLLVYLQSRGFSTKAPISECIQALKQAILPRKSGTFRKARPGNWQEHFTRENKKVFKAATGDLLIRLGYEKDERW